MSIARIGAIGAIFRRILQREEPLLRPHSDSIPKSGRLKACDPALVARTAPLHFPQAPRTASREQVAAALAVPMTMTRTKRGEAMSVPVVAIDASAGAIIRGTKQVSVREAVAAAVRLRRARRK